MFLKRLRKEEDGIGTIEILLILAVIVIIAIMFRGRIVGWIDSLLNKTGTQINQFLECPEGQQWDETAQKCAAK